MLIGMKIGVILIEKAANPLHPNAAQHLPMNRKLPIVLNKAY
jgi:hypothetical protein